MLDRRRLNEAMRRLADGDRSAFDVVYDGVSAVARRVAAAMLRATPADIDDAVQQALMKLFAQASSFAPAGDVVAWTISMTAWECRTLRRSRARDAARTRPQAPDMASDAASPEDNAIAHDMQQRLSELMGELSEADRAVVLGAIAGNAAQRKRKQRAIALLRTLWGKNHGNV